MNEPIAPEWQEIRLAQAELRRRLAELDAKIERLARLEHTSAPAAPSAPPAVDPTALKQAAAVPPPLPATTAVLPVAATPPPSTATGAPTTPAPPTESLEMRMGAYWLVRLGVVLVLTGLVFLGNYVYRHYVGPLGPAGKLSVLTLAGMALAGTGAWLERWRDNMKNYGRVLLAGGLAALYYTAYAAHFVEPLRVITSPLVGGLLLLGVAVGLVWLAERRQSPSVVVLTVLLAFYTGAMNPLHLFSLFSNLLLTLIAGWFLARHGWIRVGWAALAGSYLAFGFWRFYQMGGFVFGSGLVGHDYWVSRGFLLCYWLVFATAAFLGAGRTMPPPARAAFLSLNNAALFAYIAPSIDRVAPGWYWIYCVIFGAVLLALRRLSRRVSPGDQVTDAALLAQGILLLTLGLIGKLSGYQLPLALGMESVLLLWLAGRVGSLRPFYYIGSALAGALAIWASIPTWHHTGHLPAGVAALALTLLYAGAAWLVRWQRGLQPQPETIDLPAASAAMAMVWFGLLTAQIVTPPDKALTAALGLTGGCMLVSLAVRFGGAREAAIAARCWLFAAAVLAGYYHIETVHRDAWPLAVMAGAMGLSALVWRLVLSPNARRSWRFVSLPDLLLALLFYAWWVWAAVPEMWRVSVLAAGGFTLTALGWARRWSGATALGAALAALATAGVIWNCAQEASRAADWTVPVLLVAALPVGQALTRRGDNATDGLVTGARALVATGGALTAFLLMRDQVPAPWLTAGWTALGFILFVLGFAFRERMFRWTGLLTLAAALTRIFVRDVWQLETFGRIVSFLALGLGLLALGFFYNRFRENIQRWL